MINNTKMMTPKAIPSFAPVDRPPFLDFVCEDGVAVEV
jgi:hypothetical protein